MPNRPVSSVRTVPGDDAQILAQLGLLAGLAGSWQGQGFNLIARPDHDGGGPLFLELNITAEQLDLKPIGSPIPNRGLVQQDIELFGLTYLQQISDATTSGALHIEPGIWVTQPALTDPVQNPPPTGQIVARMGNIPHGNSILVQGSAIPVPTLTGGTFNIPPVNTAPFKVGDPMPVPGTQGGFPPYNLSDQTPAATDFRTPFGDIPEHPLPPNINGVAMQDVVNDPTRLLQQAIKGQNIQSMVVINIATQASLTSLPTHAGGPSVNTVVIDGGGGVENLAFLIPNAQTATVFATFWIETIADETETFLQLQYVQTVLLNFPILGTTTDLSWPHVSVATLRQVAPFNSKALTGFR